MIFLFSASLFGDQYAQDVTVLYHTTGYPIASIDRTMAFISDSILECYVRAVAETMVENKALSECDRIPSAKTFFSDAALFCSFQ